MTDCVKIKEALKLLYDLKLKPDEYISHKTALFFLGYGSLPEELTVVANRRRRNKDSDGFKLIFVYHGNIDNISQQIYYEGKKFKVSTLEKTLVDLVRDTSYAPEIEDIINLFATADYNLRQLISIAKATSDTVLKRTTFYLSFCGRIACEEIPTNSFKRTPIKLDPRASKDMIWSSRFYCKYPSSILSLPLSSAPASCNEEVRQWVELRAMPDFCRYQVRAKKFFLRTSGKLEFEECTQEAFCKIFESMSQQDLKNLVLSLCPDIRKPFYPWLLCDYIFNKSQLYNIRFNELRQIIKETFDFSDLASVQCALVAAIAMNLDDEVIEKFSLVCTDLFFARRFTIIALFAEKYAQRKLPCNIYVDISRAYRAMDMYDEALDMLESAKIKYSFSDLQMVHIGQLYYASSLVYKDLGANSVAIFELFIAKECFEQCADEENIARTECALGNIYLHNGQILAARANYTSGLRHAKKLGNKNLQASFLANIGLIEYDQANFKKALHFLSQAFVLNNQLQNYWNAHISGIGLGKTSLKLAKFSKTLKILKDIQHNCNKINNPSGKFEVFCLLGWLCDYLGKTAAAKAYWQESERIERVRLQRRARDVGRILKGMTYVFQKSYDLAEAEFESLLNEAVNDNSSTVQLLDRQYNYATCLAFAGKRELAKKIFKEIFKRVEHTSSRFQSLQIKLVAGILFPDAFKHLNLSKLVTAYLETGSFDPFWPHYALHAYSSNDSCLIKLLEHHINKTPHSSMEIILERFQEIEHICEKLYRYDNRASEFYNYLSSTGNKTIHKDDYVQLCKNCPSATLFFDASTGVLSYGKNKERVKSGSILNSVLLQLFLALPHGIDSHSLYRSAWGTEYDPEYDYGAFKSALHRLKRVLRSVVQDCRIIRKKSFDGKNMVQLSILRDWIVVFK